MAKSDQPRDTGRNADRNTRRLTLIVAMLVGAIVLTALLIAALRTIGGLGRGPDPETVASASLQSMREQARLTPFAARFVAVVTSHQERFGFSASKTLILPGTVRYEIDLARLQQRDLQWRSADRLLTVTLPPITVSRPQVELSEMQEYDSGGLLLRLTNTEERLDAANLKRAEAELIRQARQPLPMRLARDAARRAVERSFAMPMRAAGIEANVAVRFADEPRDDPSYLDRSRRMEDVLQERAKSKTAK
jgi:hypothetical protein